jgi:hypothetical protein
MPTAEEVISPKVSIPAFVGSVGTVVVTALSALGVVVPESVPTAAYAVIGGVYTLVQAFSGYRATDPNRV